jgi:zinc transport system permease protein
MSPDSGLSFWQSYFLWRDPLLVATMAAGLCAFVGVYIVLKRVVFVSAALSQMSGVGVAASFYLGSLAGVDLHAPPLYLHPVLFALLFALGGSALFSLNLEHRRLAGESVIGLGYLVAAAGVILILNSPRIAEEAHEVNDLLYGNAVAVQPEQIWIMAVAATCVLLPHLLFRRELVFVAFDSETARTLGMRTRLFSLLLFLSVGVAISTATRAIGALPVFAFTVVPAAAALLLVSRLTSVFALAVAVAASSAALGYYVSFRLSLPTGASMVIVAALWLLPGLGRLWLRR